MAALNDLISQIPDVALRDKIQKEVNKLSKQKKFGLVFEEHLPECTPLYDVPVQRGCNVMLRNSSTDKTIYSVAKINDDKVDCVRTDSGEHCIFDLQEIVRIAEFGEPIYPYLKPIDSICNAPDSNLWHTLIEADNYHALQLLEYLYAGKVDCIYIDPPYNTGARDWKYNNDYVDGSDAYRHSKWLSFIERRLKIAKKLLNPKDSVLIITIDEKECVHLGCLLETLFPGSRIQMITNVISAKGVVRTGQFSRVEEYIYIIEFGSSALIPSIVNMLDDEVIKEPERNIEWLGFRRRAPQAKRESRPNQFYPVFVNNQDGTIHSIGDVVKSGIDRNTIPVPVGCTALWPLSKDGDERLWSLVPEQARINLEKGYLRVNNWDEKTLSGTVYYLPSGTIKDIEEGKAKITGRNPDGSVIAMYTDAGVTPPKRVWNLKSHNAEIYGTNILNDMIGKRFDYPKSLYAVHDTLRFFVKNKPNALIVDFFAGSGTTLHAVNLLNAEDKGHRRCIIVTNNEVSDAEAKSLTKRGYKPGDPEWERLGIARYVTWPRVKCCISGKDINGKDLSGNYGVDIERYVPADNGRGKYIKKKIPVYPKMAEMKMADGFKTNAVYFKLGFLSKTSVELGMQFRELIPVLWMKAGAVGPCPALGKGSLPDYMILAKNRFAVLLNENVFEDFRVKLEEHPEIETVYFVTDYEVNYRSMVSNINVKNTYQLYRDYLDNFRINQGRSGR